MGDAKNPYSTNDDPASEDQDYYDALQTHLRTLLPFINQIINNSERFNILPTDVSKLRSVYNMVGGKRLQPDQLKMFKNIFYDLYNSHGTALNYYLPPDFKTSWMQETKLYDEKNNLSSNVRSTSNKRNQNQNSESKLSNKIPVPGTSYENIVNTLVGCLEVLTPNNENTIDKNFANVKNAESSCSENAVKDTMLAKNYIPEFSDNRLRLNKIIGIKANVAIEKLNKCDASILHNKLTTQIVDEMVKQKNVPVVHKNMLEDINLDNIDINYVKEIIDGIKRASCVEPIQPLALPPLDLINGSYAKRIHLMSTTEPNSSETTKDNVLSKSFTHLNTETNKFHNTGSSNKTEEKFKSALKPGELMELENSKVICGSLHIDSFRPVTKSNEKNTDIKTSISGISVSRDPRIRHNSLLSSENNSSAFNTPATLIPNMNNDKKNDYRQFNNLTQMHVNPSHTKPLKRCYAPYKFHNNYVSERDPRKFKSVKTTQYSNSKEYIKSKYREKNKAYAENKNQMNQDQDQYRRLVNEKMRKTNIISYSNNYFGHLNGTTSNKNFKIPKIKHNKALNDNRTVINSKLETFGDVKNNTDVLKTEKNFKIHLKADMKREQHLIDGHKSEFKKSNISEDPKKPEIINDSHNCKILESGECSKNLDNVSIPKLEDVSEQIEIGHNMVSSPSKEQSGVVNFTTTEILCKNQEENIVSTAEVNSTTDKNLNNIDKDLIAILKNPKVMNMLDTLFKDQNKIEKLHKLLDTSDDNIKKIIVGEKSSNIKSKTEILNSISDDNNFNQTENIGKTKKKNNHLNELNKGNINSGNIYGGSSTDQHKLKSKECYEQLKILKHKSNPESKELKMVIAKLDKHAKKKEKCNSDISCNNKPINVEKAQLIKSKKPFSGPLSVKLARQKMEMERNNSQNEREVKNQPEFESKKVRKGSKSVDGFDKKGKLNYESLTKSMTDQPNVLTCPFQNPKPFDDETNCNKPVEQNSNTSTLIVNKPRIKKARLSELEKLHADNAMFDCKAILNTSNIRQCRINKQIDYVFTNVSMSKKRTSNIKQLDSNDDQNDFICDVRKPKNTIKNIKKSTTKLNTKEPFVNKSMTNKILSPVVKTEVLNKMSNKQPDKLKKTKNIYKKFKKFDDTQLKVELCDGFELVNNELKNKISTEIKSNTVTDSKPFCLRSMNVNYTCVFCQVIFHDYFKFYDHITSHTGSYTDSSIDFDNLVGCVPPIQSDQVISKSKDNENETQQLTVKDLNVLSNEKKQPDSFFSIKKKCIEQNTDDISQASIIDKSLPELTIYENLLDLTIDTNTPELTINEHPPESNINENLPESVICVNPPVSAYDKALPESNMLNILTEQANQSPTKETRISTEQPEIEYFKYTLKEKSKKCVLAGLSCELINSMLLFKCSVSNCLENQFSTVVLNDFFKHINKNHQFVIWDGNCEACHHKLQTVSGQHYVRNALEHLVSHHLVLKNNEQHPNTIGSTTEGLSSLCQEKKSQRVENSLRFRYFPSDRLSIHKPTSSGVRNLYDMAAHKSQSDDTNSINKSDIIEHNMFENSEQSSNNTLLSNQCKTSVATTVKLEDTYTASHVLVHQSKSHINIDDKLIIKLDGSACKNQKKILLVVDFKKFVLPYKCIVGCCGFSCYLHNKFLEHLNQEHQQCHQLCCYICKDKGEGFIALRPDSLITHLKDHHLKKYQCIFCLFGSETIDSMIKHVASEHFELEPVCLERSTVSDNCDSKNLRNLKILRFKKVINDGMVAIKNVPVETIPEVLPPQSKKRSIEFPDNLSLVMKYPRIDEGSQTSEKVLHTFSNSSLMAESNTSMSLAIDNELTMINDMYQNRMKKSPNQPNCTKNTVNSLITQQNISLEKKHYSAIERDELDKKIIEVIVHDNINTEMFPQFIQQNMRYKCSIPLCTFTGMTEVLLKKHISTLHPTYQYYTCPHCLPQCIISKAVNINQIEFHLMHHGSNLYSCQYCNYINFNRVEMRTHMKNNHLLEIINSVQSNIIVIRQTMLEDDSIEKGRSKIGARCTENKIMPHFVMAHKLSNMFECHLCQFEHKDAKIFEEHYKLQHPFVAVKCLKAFEKINDNEDFHKQSKHLGGTENLLRQQALESIEPTLIPNCQEIPIESTPLRMYNKTRGISKSPKSATYVQHNMLLPELNKNSRAKHVKSFESSKTIIVNDKITSYSRTKEENIARDTKVLVPQPAPDTISNDDIINLVDDSDDE